MGVFFLECKKMIRFRDVDDVDLFVALNLEDPVDGGLVGPVTQCLLVKQFKDLSTGDRFFYTHQNALTPGRIHFLYTLIFISYYLAQRQYVENLSFACFICLTVDIDQVPKQPFVTPTDE